MVNVLRMEARRKQQNLRPGLLDCAAASRRSEASSMVRKGGKVRKGRRAVRAHEALPHASPGGRPPETPLTELCQGGARERAHEALPHASPGGRPPETPWQNCARAARVNARMRRCLMLRQGASPLRPPAPFPFRSMLGNGSSASRVRQPRTQCAPLTPPIRSEDCPVDQGKGASEMCPLAARCASRWSAPARIARWRSFKNIT